MSANKHEPHVRVLPEDDANRQLANGFQLGVDWSRQRQIEVLRVAGGWQAVVDRFQADHVASMNRNTNIYMVLLIDFDREAGRRQYVESRIPEHLRERVFIIGAWSRPEDLRPPSYESIGKALARDCREETSTTWEHTLLRHNAREFARLREHVRPILF